VRVSLRVCVCAWVRVRVFARTPDDMASQKLSQEVDGAGRPESIAESQPGHQKRRRMSAKGDPLMKNCVPISCVPICINVVQPGEPPPHPPHTEDRTSHEWIVFSPYPPGPL